MHAHTHARTHARTYTFTHTHTHTAHSLWRDSRAWPRFWSISRSTLRASSGARALVCGHGRYRDTHKGTHTHRHTHTHIHTHTHTRTSATSAGTEHTMPTHTHGGPHNTHAHAHTPDVGEQEKPRRARVARIQFARQGPRGPVRQHGEVTHALRACRVVCACVCVRVCVRVRIVSSWHQRVGVCVRVYVSVCVCVAVVYPAAVGVREALRGTRAGPRSACSME
jgi:hypothetical protein